MNPTASFSGTSGSSPVLVSSEEGIQLQEGISHHAQQQSSSTTFSSQLQDHLKARLETGVDDEPEITDTFLQTCKRETAFVIAREYHYEQHDGQVKQHILSQVTASLQAQELERVFNLREPGSMFWVNVMGLEETVLKKTASVCDLEPETFLKALKNSRHRLHRTSVEFHSSYMYCQLLIQQPKLSSGKGNNLLDPFLDMVQDSWIPPQSQIASEEVQESKKRAQRKRWEKWVKGNEWKETVNVGFMSVFVIPSANMVVTVSLPYYGDPASRLAIDMSKALISAHDQIEIYKDCQLLGISAIHRVVGYASGCMRQISQLISQWDRESHENYTTSRAQELKSLVHVILDFKRRLLPLKNVHSKIIDEVRHPQSSLKSHQHQEIIDKNLVFAAELLVESQERLFEVMEEVELALEKCRHLEEFTFAMISTNASDSMERLAIVTIVFLPLTFIASYFSMGFDNFPDLSRPPTYFWEVSVPLSIAFFAVFAWSNIRRAWLRAFRAFLLIQDWTRKQYHFTKMDVKLWWMQKVEHKNQRDRSSGHRSRDLAA
ncbi:hypothetical protein IAR50_003628 [Cryptococcus sp. DSM 104548]